MSDVFKAGELFVYVNGDRWELGMVKRENNSGDGYFCWYHRGDTAANTPTRCMHKLANAGWTHIEQQLDDLRADFQASEHVINQIADVGFEVNAENEKLREEVKTLKRIAKDNLVSAVEHERFLEADNDKLRDLAKYAILCSEGDVRCEACPYHDKSKEPHIICTMRKAAIELGIEVPE